MRTITFDLPGDAAAILDRYAAGKHLDANGAARFMVDRALRKARRNEIGAAIMQAPDTDTYSALKSENDTHETELAQGTNAAAYKDHRLPSPEPIEAEPDVRL